MRCKKLISTVAVVAIMAAGAGFYYTTQQQSAKQQLVMETFAPHFDQVEDLKTRINGQLKLQFVASNLAEDHQQELFGIVDKHVNAISAHIMDLVLSTYTADELKAKREFESGDYMIKLLDANSEINVAVKVYAQHLNRLGTLEQLRENFNQEKGAPELREVITKLANDTTTPDQERLEMIADELGIPKPQATPVLILLALSKQAIEMQQHYLAPKFGEADAETIAAAKHFIELNHLDTMLEANDNFLADASMADFDTIRDELTNILAAVVVKHVDPETLAELNAYFETPKAQAILEKDIKLAGEIGPQIQDMIEAMQNSLKAKLVQYQEEAVAEAAEEVEEAAEDAAEIAEELAEDSLENAAE